MPIKKINIKRKKCRMRDENPREFFMRLQTGVVNNFSWSDGKPIVINLN